MVYGLNESQSIDFVFCLRPKHRPNTRAQPPNSFISATLTDILTSGSQGILAPDAICYHNGLVMAAMHYSWLRGSYKEIEPMYIFHKLVIIRAVNKAISEPAPVAKTGIIEAINALSMSEVRQLLGNAMIESRPIIRLC